MTNYGKSTLRFLPASIISTEELGVAAGAAAGVLAAGTGDSTMAAGRMRRGAGCWVTGLACSLLSAPGSGAGMACSPESSVRLF